MALSTIHTALMHKASSASDYAKLVCIKDYPDLGGTPSTIETTTLCDEVQTFIEGVKSNDALEFTANYTLTDYQALLALKGTQENYAVYFGENGENGKFLFKGSLSVRVSGKGVDEVREMVITITPSTAVELDD